MFWKPGTKFPGEDRETEKEGVCISYNPYEKLSIAQQRCLLPIYKSREQILYAVERYQVVIVVGQTGCGKTTQIPQYLKEAGWTAGGRIVACTQPRRVAATSVATRVAEECHTTLGQEVGYSIRFEDVSDPEKTQIKYLTDGMLLREVMLDPLLSNYSAIMLDEAHERSLHTDILIGLLKKIMRKRKDLRVIVSSATIDAEDMKNFFNTNTTNNPQLDNVCIMSIEGRTYNVEMNYLKEPCYDYLDCALNTVLQIHKLQPPGDILVFMSGQEEIDKLVESIVAEASLVRGHSSLKLMALPIYSGLPSEEQLKVFSPAPYLTRKVIVATNIAETSLTIEGIIYVVDSGFVKLRAYDSQTGMETLIVQPVSQSSAQQRAGRAGRQQPGKCYRLYTEEAFNQLSPCTPPEMLRSNLASLVLQLKALGIHDLVNFDFVSSPPPEALCRALELNFALGALDRQCKLTPGLGTTMAELPVEPTLAKMIISSGEFKCSEEMITIAAMLQIQSVFIYPKGVQTAADSSRKKFAVQEGEHITLLNIYNAFVKNNMESGWCHENHLNYRGLLRAVEIRKQLARYAKHFNIPSNSCGTDSVAIRKCIVSGFFSNAAQLQPDGTYKTIRGGHTLSIHPSSVLFKTVPEWVIFHEIVLTTKEYMRDVTTIDPVWLHELAPHFYEYIKPKAHQII